MRHKLSFGEYIFMNRQTNLAKIFCYKIIRQALYQTDIEKQPVYPITDGTRGYEAANYDFQSKMFLLS
jgi:hypothetical protein